VDITLLNPELSESAPSNFTAFVGDGRSMPQFEDHQFDIVFSNSTIEHVGSIDDQRAMAREIVRVGRKYYVQTPNRYFPIEPHFVFPFF
jgi:ubiquinone/menaquinone biosynthesis C-methylase UbiE